MSTALALLLTWVALDVAILWALSCWKQPDEQPAPPPDLVIAYIGPKRLVRKGRR